MLGVRPPADGLDERHRQSPSSSGDEPDRHVDRRRGDGGESRAHRGDDATVEHASASTSTRSTRRMASSIDSGSDGLDVDAGAVHARTIRPPSSPASTGEDRHAARVAQRPSRRSPGSRRSRTVTSSGSASASRAGVSSPSISSARCHASGERLGLGEEVGAQPPQRPARRVALDEVATQRDELARRRAQARQRRRPSRRR